MPEELRDWAHDTLLATAAGVGIGGVRQWLEERQQGAAVGVCGGWVVSEPPRPACIPALLPSPPPRAPLAPCPRCRAGEGAARRGQQGARRAGDGGAADGPAGACAQQQRAWRTARGRPCGSVLCRPDPQRHLQGCPRLLQHGLWRHGRGGSVWRLGCVAWGPAGAAWEWWTCALPPRSVAERGGEHTLSTPAKQCCKGSACGRLC